MQTSPPPPNITSTTKHHLHHQTSPPSPNITSTTKHRLRPQTLPPPPNITSTPKHHLHHQTSPGNQDQDEDLQNLRKEFLAFKKQMTLDMKALSSKKTFNHKNSTPNKEPKETSQKTYQKTSYVYTPRDKYNNPKVLTEPEVPTIPIVPGLHSYKEAVALDTSHHAFPHGHPHNQSSTGSTSTDEGNVEEDIQKRRVERVRKRRNERNQKTLVIGSSHARSIDRKSVNDLLQHGTVDIHSFSGKTARYITKYMRPHLEEECPHTVVLIAGGNDIPWEPASSQKLHEIASCLIEGGLDCRNNYGVTKVCISSILPQVFSIFQRNRRILNDILRDLCMKHGFIFIENDNIILGEHIDRKGVHLNGAGSEIFIKNLVDVLNA